MRTKQELLLGKQAVALKLITREQLKECIKIQEQKHIPLPLIFLKQGLVKEKDLMVLLEEYFKRADESETRDKGEDLVLCRLLLRSKSILPDVLLKLVIQQKKERESQVPLTQLILRSNLIPLVKFLEIYSNLYDETFTCSGCEKEFRLINLWPGKKLRCKHCKTIFSIPTLEEEIAAYDSDPEFLPTPSPREDLFADYEILEEVAEGGMGIIYRAQKKSTGKIVALKVLREAHRSSAEAKERFAREAKTLSRLKHKNIVSVLDVGIENEVPYFTMDFIEGKPLSDLIIEKGLSLDEILSIVGKICEALQYAHEAGIIHRDIKPSNIIMDLQGEPRITDFGLAKCIDSGTMVTRSGTMLGTPYYMSPEQARGQLGLVGPRSDIYSLGVVFYEMLTGKNPFKGENTVEIYHNILTVDPPAPSTFNKEVYKQIDAVCLKCLKKDSFQRYRYAADLASDLRRIQSGSKGWVHSLFKKIKGK